MWKCFHCNFETDDHDEAAAHFGDGDGDPALCVFWESMDDAERAHAYQQMMLELNATRDEVRDLQAAIEHESSDGMRLYRELRARMARDLQRAEEDGYARGLRDSQLHPETLVHLLLERSWLI